MSPVKYYPFDGEEGGVLNQTWTNERNPKEKRMFQNEGDDVICSSAHQSSSYAVFDRAYVKLKYKIAL